ncbi:MAG: alpha/beta hydrolase [Candidatus Gracilibacteria bacterium]|jgi:triacylglycerol esterase/lipase EstA (alpha/beta hydrolase family)
MKFSKKIKFTAILLSITIILIVGLILLLNKNPNTGVTILTSDENADCIFLLHGLARSSKSMEPLAKSLNDIGYTTINIKYSSTKYNIETLSEKFLKPIVNEYCTEKNKKINFVTHSLGGIVVRQFLSKNTLENLNKIIMIAPPNKGSEIADFVTKIPIVRSFYGPALKQLGTDKNSLPLKIIDSQYTLGIIAGNISYNPLFSYFLPDKDDGKVSVEKTKMNLMTDFIEVKSTHTFIMQNKKVIELVKKFLKDEKFQ